MDLVISEVSTVSSSSLSPDKSGSCISRVSDDGSIVVEPSPRKKTKPNNTNTNVELQTEDSFIQRSIRSKTVVRDGLHEDLQTLSRGMDDDSVQSFLNVMFSICSQCYSMLSPRHITVCTPTHATVSITQECTICGCKRTWTTDSFSQLNPNCSQEPPISESVITGITIKEEIVSDDDNDLAATNGVSGCSSEETFHELNVIDTTIIKEEPVNNNYDQNNEVDLEAANVIPIVCIENPTSSGQNKEISNTESDDIDLASANGRFWFSDSIELFPDVQSASLAIANDKRWVFLRQENIKSGAKSYFRCRVAGCGALLISNEHNTSVQSGMVTVFRSEPHTNHDVANKFTFEHSNYIFPL